MAAPAVPSADALVRLRESVTTAGAMDRAACGTVDAAAQRALAHGGLLRTLRQPLAEGVAKAASRAGGGAVAGPDEEVLQWVAAALEAATAVVMDGRSPSATAPSVASKREAVRLGYVDVAVAALRVVGSDRVVAAAAWLLAWLLRWAEGPVDDAAEHAVRVGCVEALLALFSGPSEAVARGAAYALSNLFFASESARERGRACGAVSSLRAAICGGGDERAQDALSTLGNWLVARGQYGPRHEVALADPELLRALVRVAREQAGSAQQRATMALSYLTQGPRARVPLLDAGCEQVFDAIVRSAGAGADEAGAAPPPPLPPRPRPTSYAVERAVIGLAALTGTAEDADAEAATALQSIGVLQLLARRLAQALGGDWSYGVASEVLHTLHVSLTSARTCELVSEQEGMAEALLALLARALRPPADLVAAAGADVERALAALAEPRFFDAADEDAARNSALECLLQLALNSPGACPALAAHEAVVAVLEAWASSARALQPEAVAVPEAAPSERGAGPRSRAPPASSSHGPQATWLSIAELAKVHAARILARPAARAGLAGAADVLASVATRGVSVGGGEAEGDGTGEEGDGSGSGGGGGGDGGGGWRARSSSAGSVPVSGGAEGGVDLPVDAAAGTAAVVPRAATPGSGDAEAGTAEASAGRHVMISYSWAYQALAVGLARRLQRLGFLVWLDIDQMHGSTLEAMAHAVEGAGAVVYTVGSAYKRSANCRLEAEYAARLLRPMIPVVVERHFAPDGWLGIITGAKLWFSLAAPGGADIEATLDAETPRIAREIARHVPPKLAITPVLAPAGLPQRATAGGEEGAPAAGGSQRNGVVAVRVVGAGHGRAAPTTPGPDGEAGAAPDNGDPRPRAAGQNDALPTVPPGREVSDAVDAWVHAGLSAADVAQVLARRPQRCFQALSRAIVEGDLDGAALGELARLALASEDAALRVLEAIERQQLLPLLGHRLRVLRFLRTEVQRDEPDPAARPL